MGASLLALAKSIYQFLRHFSSQRNTLFHTDFSVAARKPVLGLNFKDIFRNVGILRSGSYLMNVFIFLFIFFHTGPILIAVFITEMVILFKHVIIIIIIIIITIIIFRLYKIFVFNFRFLRQGISPRTHQTLLHNHRVKISEIRHLHSVHFEEHLKTIWEVFCFLKVV